MNNKFCYTASCLLFIKLIVLVFVLTTFVPINAVPKDQKLQFKEAIIEHPIPSIPYYHFKIEAINNTEIPFYIKKIVVNGKEVTHYEIREVSWESEDNEVFHYNWAPFAANYSKDFVYKHFNLIARVNWENGKKYNVKIIYTFKDNPEIKIIEQNIVAPANGGYWNSEWKYYKSVVVSEDFGLERKDEPIQFSMVFYPDQITDLNKELRVVKIDKEGNTALIPSQVYDIQKYLKEDKPRYDKDGKLRPFYWLPSIYAKIVVPITINANSNIVLLVFYGNEKAENLKNESTLKINGEGLGLTIENEFYKIKLHPKSGMLHEITLKNKPHFTLEHKLETNGAIHWNPGAYSPKRPWMHASDWNPPESIKTVSGPVMFMFNRKGHMPNMPEIALSITYKFFANSPFVLMSSAMEIKKPVPLQAFRNAEIVFNSKLIDKAVWLDPAYENPKELDISTIPNLTEVDLPLDVSWISFLNTKEKIGFAGIPLEYCNASLNDEPFEYNPYIYITKGPWVYWTRVLVTPYMTQNMQQIVEVPAGNCYWEKWAWLPFETRGNNLKELNYLQAKLKHPLRIQVRDEKDARVRIPDEIYTDSTKTGWEENK